MSFCAKMNRMIIKIVMKKFSVILCLILVAVALSACSAFHNDTTKNYPQTNPQASTIFLRVKTDTTIDARTIQDWQAAVYDYQKNDETATKITKIKDIVPEADHVYRVNLTLANVPDSTATKVVRPFKITYQQTIYNPLALLPDNEVFAYYILYSSERRHSSASTTAVEQEDGQYIYVWNDGTTITFTDIYPNRPLYLLIIIAGATVVGVLVFITSRYYDCKKRKYQL